MRINIKQATAQDAKIISHIHALSWKRAYKGIIPAQYLYDLRDDHWVDGFSRCITDGDLTANIILENNIPVGCISYGKARDQKRKNWGEIVSMYILPDSCNRGYGQKLLEKALQNMKQRDLNDIYLWVLAENVKAQRFYKNNGFVCTKDKYKFEIMEKQLTNIRYILSL